MNLKTLGRLKDAQEFEQIILKTTPDGRIAGSRTSPAWNWAPRASTSTSASTASRPVFSAIFSMPDANALETPTG